MCGILGALRGEWFKKELKQVFWEVIDETSIKKQGIFNFIKG